MCVDEGAVDMWPVEPDGRRLGMVGRLLMRAKVRECCGGRRDDTAVKGATDSASALACERHNEQAMRRASASAYVSTLTSLPSLPHPTSLSPQVCISPVLRSIS